MTIKLQEVNTIYDTNYLMKPAKEKRRNMMRYCSALFSAWYSLKAL